MTMNRDQIANKEMTRDPIFLFQIKVLWVAAEHHPYEHNGDYLLDERGEEIQDQQIIDEGWAHEYWDTKYVFGTREEANQFKHVNRYKYAQDKMRVYCVCAEGSLAKHLAGTYLLEDIAQSQDTNGL